MYKLCWKKAKRGKRIKMSRILKALLKTIAVVLGMILFIFLANMFPYLLITLIIISIAIFLFFSFYENEED